MGALDDLRVLDVTQVMAGPFCTMLLADFGADVIKIEPPAGDSTRTMPGAVGTDSPSFNAVNRGKRSVMLNLKTAEGRDALKRLARDADILVENYRPGVLAALGLDYESLRAVNPRLIYASISGYGQTGPDSRKGGFDLVAQGISGIMSITGDAGGPPVKAGIPLTDLGAGLFALIGILAALEHRHRNGAGHTSIRRSSTLASRVGVGGDGVLRRSRPAAAERIRASHVRAVSGDSLRRRLHHAGHGQRSLVPSILRSAPASGMDDGSGVRRQHAAGAQSAGARGAHRSGHARAAAGALAGVVRGERDSVRADQQLRTGVCRPAHHGAGDGGRGRASHARPHEVARLGDQDERHADEPAPPRAHGANTLRPASGHGFSAEESPFAARSCLPAHRRGRHRITNGAATCRLLVVIIIDIVDRTIGREMIEGPLRREPLLVGASWFAEGMNPRKMRVDYFNGQI